MLHSNTASKLLINGFTINPIKEVVSFKESVSGFFDYAYKQKHVCDFTGKEIHTNYLKQRVEEVFVSNIIKEHGRCLTGFVILNNGYYTVTISYDKHPAEIQFDLYLDEYMSDPDLIIDHLCAPAVPFDGFGMFDYTYSLTHIAKPKSIISDVYNNIRYTNNEPFNISLYNGDQNYEIVLNQLKEIHCYFCEKEGKYFGFTGEAKRVVTVCKEHLNHIDSSNQEGGSEGMEIDKRVVKKYNDQFIKVFEQDNSGNIVSKHIKENNG